MRRSAAYLQFTALLLVLTAPIATAQSQVSLAPQKIGVIYFVQGDSLIELPRVVGKKKTATFITARSKLRMVLEGLTSNIKFGDSMPSFAVLLPSGDIMKLSLYPLTIKGKSREAVVGTGGSLYGENSTGAEILSVDVLKAGADVYRITPSKALIPGEYALAFAGSNEFFCFTIP